MLQDLQERCRGYMLQEGVGPQLCSTMHRCRLVCAPNRCRGVCWGYVGPLEDHVGPPEDRGGPREDYVGPREDCVGAREDHVGPVRIMWAP